MTKISVAILVATMVMTSSLLYCLVQGERVDGHGVPHPEFAAMDQGGSPARHDDLLLPATIYGGIQVVLLTTSLYLGVGARRGAVMPIFAGGVCYLAVFIAMVRSYASGIADAPVVLGLPMPTALMVYGMWVVPVVFVVLYVVKFGDWIYGEAEAAEFAALLQTARDEGARSESDG